ncbi:MAG: NYN domain-containing protein [Deltaproteobacteria bacterium]|nr:NYN domain-containing protein [Deltaproteobacteria bacterium]
MPKVFPASYQSNARVMIFVDGENLSIRFKSFIDNEKLEKLEKHIGYEKDIYVWSPFLNLSNHNICAIVRIFYYTSLKGDDDKIRSIFDALKSLGVTDPKIFKKKPNNKTKRVDITLATDMLSNAYNNNFDIAILVAGDEDYIPLVQELKHCGKQISLWFLEDGLSQSLKRECDHFFDMKQIFLTEGNLLSQYPYT